MNKEIIGKNMVAVTMTCLTFIFAALAEHYDVFTVGFRETPLVWPDALIAVGAVVFCFVVALGIGCMVAPPIAMVLLMPLEVWKNISEKHGKWQHLINLFLLALCVAFVAYAINLVTILEHLSGEHFKQMPTFGGLLAVFYAWIIAIGTIILFGWLSGLTDAVIAFFKRCAEAEAERRHEQEKLERKREKRRLRRKRGRKHKARPQAETEESEAVASA